MDIFVDKIFILIPNYLIFKKNKTGLEVWLKQK
jgi:hypothetical protein